MPDDVATPDVTAMVAWLREQIDEDERVAQAANERHPGTWISSESGDLSNCEPVSTGGAVMVDGVGWVKSQPAVRHITRHDPARVLREVEAKRRILDEHRQVTFTDVSLGIRDAQVCWSCHGALIPDDTDDWDGDVPTVQVPFPCKTIRLLALPYVDRPGYREEWRP